MKHHQRGYAMKSTKARVYLPAALAVAALVALAPVVQAAQVKPAEAPACRAVVTATWSAMNKLHRTDRDRPELWHYFFFGAAVSPGGVAVYGGPGAPMLGICGDRS